MRAALHIAFKDLLLGVRDRSALAIAVAAPLGLAFILSNLLGGAGRAMVKSAGNEGARNRHASGTVPATGTQGVQFTMPPGRAFPVTIDLWYDGPERIDIALTPPGGAATPGSCRTA
jgi:hypothetical protein